MIGFFTVKYMFLERWQLSLTDYSTNNVKKFSYSLEY